MTDEPKDEMVEQPAESADGSDDPSELDDLLRAIDAAAVPGGAQDPSSEAPGSPAKDGAPVVEAVRAAAPPTGPRPADESQQATAQAEAPSETSGTDEVARAAQNDRVENEVEQNRQTPAADAPPDRPAEAGAGATSASGNAGMPSDGSATPQEPTGDAGSAQEAPAMTGSDNPRGGTAEPVETVSREAAVDQGGGPSEDAAARIVTHDAVDDSAVEIGGGVEDEPTASEGIGAPVEPVPLVVAEALAETEQRRRRHLLYILVPTLAVGLVAALTQVRLGGKDESPAVRNWAHGTELVESGDLTRGLETLEDVVATTPLGMNRTFAHARLAEVYARLATRQAHYYNGAIRHYSAVLDEISAGRADTAALPVDELLYKAGRCFIALGSYQTALEYFEQIDREHPGSRLTAQAQLDMAECLMATGEYQRARQVLANLAETHRGEPLGQQAFFRFAASFDEEAQSLEDRP